MKVEKLMSRDVAVCRPSDSLNDAVRLFWERDVGCLPVVDRDRRVIGMVTDRDVCMAAYFSGQALSGLRVESIMARGVRTCRSSDSIEEVLAALKSHLVHRLPVVDAAGCLEGMLSLFDLARFSADGDPRAKDLVRTLAAIHEPRKLEPPVEKPAPALPKGAAPANKRAANRSPKQK